MLQTQPTLLSELGKYADLFRDLSQKAFRFDNEIKLSQINGDYAEGKSSAEQQQALVSPYCFVETEFGERNFHHDDDDIDKVRPRAVVMHFLWTTWQRSTRLVLYWIVRNQTQCRVIDSVFAPRGAVLANGGDLTGNSEKMQLPAYMCP